MCGRRRGVTGVKRRRWRGSFMVCFAVIGKE
jgi:hypothetical protein